MNTHRNAEAAITAYALAGAALNVLRTFQHKAAREGRTVLLAIEPDGTMKEVDPR